MKINRNALVLVMMVLVPFTRVYSQTSGQWIWQGDDSAANMSGVYGTKGVASPGNRPGAQYICGSYRTYRRNSKR